MSDIHSLWSFEEIRRSKYVGKLQAEILSLFTENPTKSFMSDEIVDHLRRRFRPKLEKQPVSPRFAELEKIGFIEKAPDRLNPETNMTVNCWKWTGRKTPLPVRTEWMECLHCNGKGKVMKEVRVKPNEDYSRKDLFA